MQISSDSNRTVPAAQSLPRKLAQAVAAQSSLYREVVAEREEIMRHKWLLSERAGCDVGYSRAMFDWIAHHRAGWRKTWRQKNGRRPEPA